MTNNYNALENRNISVHNIVDSDYHRMVFHLSGSSDLAEQTRESFSVRLAKNDTVPNFCDSDLCDIAVTPTQMSSEAIERNKPLTGSLLKVPRHGRLLTSTKVALCNPSGTTGFDSTINTNATLKSQDKMDSESEFNSSRAKRMRVTRSSPINSQFTDQSKPELLTGSSVLLRESTLAMHKDNPVHISNQKSFTTAPLIPSDNTCHNFVTAPTYCPPDNVTQMRSSYSVTTPPAAESPRTSTKERDHTIPSWPRNHEPTQRIPLNVQTPSSAPSPTSSYTGSLLPEVDIRCESTNKVRKPIPQLSTDHTTHLADEAARYKNMAVCSSESQLPHRVPAFVPTQSSGHPVDTAGVYIPGTTFLMNEIEITPIDLISRFENTPISSPAGLRSDSHPSITALNDTSFSQLPNQMDSNIAQRPASSAHTSPVSVRSAGHEANKASKNRYAQMRRQLRKRMEQDSRQPLPALHLHLSKDGTSPLPPGWQRAPNVKQRNHSTTEGSSGGDDTDGLYAYYYYHVRTRQTRWDPPVYPWDADPEDTLTGGKGDDDPEAPYNWGCASKYSVSHEEIEAMYGRLRQRILERQCTELLHELADKPDAPKGAVEQNFAIELFTHVHDVLRTFRDARCKVGRILNDEDLYYLTRKLAQAVILKEVQKWRADQAASSSSLFASAPAPELTASVTARVSTYVKRYMESKGAFYRRRVQQGPIPPVSSQKLLAHGKPDGAVPSYHHRHHHHSQHQHSSRTAPPLRMPIGHTHPPPHLTTEGPSGHRTHITPPKPVPNIISGTGRHQI